MNIFQWKYTYLVDSKPWRKNSISEVGEVLKEEGSNEAVDESRGCIQTVI